MEENKTSKRIHPLVAGAAISVMLVSLTGVAAITGLIPNSYSTSAPHSELNAATAPAIATAATAATSPVALLDSKTEPPVLAEQRPAAPVSAPAPIPAAQPRSHSSHTAQKSQSQPRHVESQSSEPVRVAKAPEVCTSCGRIESVQAIREEAKASGLGMVGGAVLGGVLGNQIGGGKGRTLATVAGAVGGGYAGNEVEKRTRATTTYQVRVRMEDGHVRTFPYAQQPGWNVGDQVKVVNGSLTSRG